MNNKGCIKCDGKMVECFFQSPPIIVRSPSQKLFEDRSTVITPYVCPNCGYIEFYAREPKKLSLD